MADKFIRVYQKRNLSEIKSHLLLYGALSGQCAACQKLDVSLNATHCPECKQEFRFMAFQNIRDHLPKMNKIHAERPHIEFVDYDDFKRLSAAEKAKNFLKDS